MGHIPASSGLTQVDGLPAHVLLVHAVVVLVPLTALLLVGYVVVPAVRRRLGVLLPLLALVTFALVPVTTHAGEWLEGQLGSSPLIQRHAALGDSMLPWAGGLLLACVLAWLRFRRSTATGAGARGAAARPAGGRVVGAVVLVIALVAAVGSVVTVYRIGESGSRATWSGVVSSGR